MQYEMKELHNDKALEDGEQLVEIILDLYDDLLQKWEHFRQQHGSSSSDQFRHKSVGSIVQQRQREIAEEQRQKSPTKEQSKPILSKQRSYSERHRTLLKQSTEAALAGSFKQKKVFPMEGAIKEEG